MCSQEINLTTVADKTAPVRFIASALLCLAISTLTNAQPSVSIDLTGVTLVEGATFQASAGPIDAAAGYRAELTVDVLGIGTRLGAAIPTSTSLETIVVSSGGIPNDVLIAHVDDPDGVHPSPSFERTITLVGGRLAPFLVEISYTARVAADSMVELTIDTMNIEPRTDMLQITGGCFTMETVDPPVPDKATEWQLDGDFSSYGDDAVIRFRDDAAFNPPFEFDLTDDLSAVAPPVEFGLPPITGTDPMIMRVGGADQTALPAGGMGLVVWPNSSADHPDGFIDQWTIIMDILIPASSWNGAEDYIALVKFDPGAGGDADLFVQIEPPGIGTKSQIRESMTVGPDTWMRVAFVGDTSTGLTEVYVNGDSLGGIDGVSPISNRLSLDAPAYANGELITLDQWTSWGSFPSPWATNLQSGIEAGYALFADDDAENWSLYLAGVHHSDQTTPPSKIAILDDPDDDRIILCQVACDADMNCDCGVGVLDLLDFLGLWFDDQIDFNSDLAFDVLDLLSYLDKWFEGCPDS